MDRTKRVFASPAVGFLLLAFLLVAAGAILHHGWSNYDQDVPLDLTGAIEEFSYENPHGMLQLQTEDTTWTVVLSPPARMNRRGLTQRTLADADSAQVYGHPHKRTAGEMRAKWIRIGSDTTGLLQ